MSKIISKRWVKYPLIMLGIFWLLVWLGYEAPGTCGGKAGCFTDTFISVSSYPLAILGFKLDLLSGPTNGGELKFIDTLVACINILLLGIILAKLIDGIVYIFDRLKK